MLFDQLMFDNPTMSRFHIYRSLFIHAEGIYQVHFFADLHGLNYQQMVGLLTDIDEDLKQINPEHEKVLERNGKINLFHLDVGIDEYRYFLLQRSVPFLFIQEILNGEEMTVDDFCLKHDISRSTVSRKLSAISKFLRKYRIRFTYTPLDIVGDETLIRLTLFYLYWIGVRDIAWPFKISKEEVENIMKEYPNVLRMSNNYLGKKEMFYLFAIFASRVKKGKFVKDYKEWKTFFDNNPYYENVLLKKMDGLDDKFRLAETHFFLFLTHFIPYYSEKDSEDMQQTIRDFRNRHSDHPLSIMNDKFMYYVNENLFTNLDRETEDLLMANFINISFTYYVLNSSIPDFEVLGTSLYPTTDAHRELHAKVKDFFDKLFTSNTYSRFKNSKESLIRRYTNLLLPYYYEQGKSPVIRVGIALERNQILLQRLKMFLKSLNFVEIEDFAPENVHQYDLVISSTTSILQDFPGVKLFYWDIEYGHNELMFLYQYLQQTYLTPQEL
ncbi:Mga helix-turn-helix domain-containing protein [Pilibacter termitis]|uniref:Mga helix-turn-helix domain-containing protein n=1 Tax=Pilibacter termitis TaxID=263852 RepID=A0A1T4MBW0_9ENTE|nr:helix-turn-helix domain-containing protein [Pilibacter termitis]SJZ64530.1 Mga helix-turn-helix domain-containing protein [Pilibacter termitis]